MNLLGAMSPQAVDFFFGVGNPFSLGSIGAGETVMDVGSGGGFDCFVAGKTVGPTGKVIGIDMTEPMVTKSRATAREMGLKQVYFCHGLAEELPIQDASVDVAISNGVINLCPDKHRAFAEIFRTLKPGGRLYLVDIVSCESIPDAAKASVDLWTALVGGVLQQEEYLDVIRQAGFVDVTLVSTVEVFAGAEWEGNARLFDIVGANIRAKN